MKLFGNDLANSFPNCHKLRQYIIPTITQRQHLSTTEDGLVEDMLKEMYMEKYPLFRPF